MSDLTKAANSSTIAAHGYDPASRVLTVQFHNGGTYEYSDVPEETHAAFVGSDSLGKFLHQNIKGRFEHKRLP